jgi:hypothetical protein
MFTKVERGCWLQEKFEPGHRGVGDSFRELLPVAYLPQHMMIGTYPSSEVWKMGMGWSFCLSLIHSWSKSSRILYRD